MTPERIEQLDAELRSTRARIAAVQDRLGEIHRDRSIDLAEVAAQQQPHLLEMGELQRRLSDLDIERRGFGTRRRP